MRRQAFGYKTFTVRNDSTDWVPAHGVMRITSYENVDGTIRRVVNKPDVMSETLQDPNQLCVNGPQAIPPGEDGQASQDYPLLVLRGVGSSFTSGALCGPQADSWMIHEHGGAWTFLSDDPTSASVDDQMELAFIDLPLRPQTRRFRIVGYHAAVPQHYVLDGDSYTIRTGETVPVFWAYAVPERERTYERVKQTVSEFYGTEYIGFSVTPPVYGSPFYLNYDPFSYDLTYAEDQLRSVYPELVKVMPPFELNTIEASERFVSLAPPYATVTAERLDEGTTFVVNTAVPVLTTTNESVPRTDRTSIPHYVLTSGNDSTLYSLRGLSDDLPTAEIEPFTVYPISSSTQDNYNTYNKFHVTGNWRTNQSTFIKPDGTTGTVYGALVVKDASETALIQFKPAIHEHQLASWGVINSNYSELWPGLPGFIMTGKDPASYGNEPDGPERYEIPYVDGAGNEKTLFVGRFEVQNESMTMYGKIINGNIASGAMGDIRPVIWDDQAAALKEYNGTDQTSEGVTLPSVTLEVHNMGTRTLNLNSYQFYKWGPHYDDTGACMIGCFIEA